MKHKYKAIHFVDGNQVCEWKEEEIDPVLYLNDYYNFLDIDEFENAYGHGKGSKNYIYEVLKKHLEALKIIKRKRVNVRAFLKCCHREDGLLIYNNQCDNDSAAESKELTPEEFDLLREVLS